MAASEVTTINVLNGYTKDIYSKLVDLVPKGMDLYPETSFNESEAQGGTYRQNVILSEEGGFTHAAAGDGPVTTNAGVSLETGDAQVNGYQVILQGTIDYESAARASNSKRAYADIVGKKLANMVLSAKKRVECEMWWGQAGLGTIASTTTASGGKTTATITEAEFAPYIWAGKKNFKVVVYNSDGSAVSGVGAAYFTIESVNVTNRTLVLVESVSGDAAELKTRVDAAAGDVSLYWHSAAQGASTIAHKSMIGIMKAANTTTSTLWNIDVSNDLWAPNQFNVNSTKLSFEKLLNAGEVLINRGYTGKVIAHVSHTTWRNLMSDQAALKRFGGSESKLKNGAKAIEFDFQSTTLQVRGCGWMKRGYFLLRPESGLKRIGAQDVSFKRPGNSKGNGENIFWDDPTRAGYSYRCYTHQAVFMEEPWQLLYGYGIVNV